MTAVMIPRMSVLMKENKIDEVRKYTDVAFKLLFLFSFPIICFVELFAPDIICLFAGAGFEGAILPMRIIILQLLVIGAEKIIVLQLLVPLRKDNTIVKAGLAGVVVWALLTILLVPKFSSMGTAIVWVAAETTVLIISTIETKRSLEIRFPFRQLLLSVGIAIPYLLMGGVVLIITHQPIIRILLCMPLFVTYASVLETKVYQTGIIKTISNVIFKTSDHA
jgi:O-antigen/teichoic acid export membrane protein